MWMQNDIPGVRWGIIPVGWNHLLRLKVGTMKQKTVSVKDLYEALKRMDKAGLITDEKVQIFLDDGDDDGDEYQITEMSHFHIEPNLVLKIKLAED